MMYNEHTASFEEILYNLELCENKKMSFSGRDELFN